MPLLQTIEEPPFEKEEEENGNSPMSSYSEVDEKVKMSPTLYVEKQYSGYRRTFMNSFGGMGYSDYVNSMEHCELSKSMRELVNRLI